jgi:hypothetical protein
LTIPTISDKFSTPIDVKQRKNDSEVAARSADRNSANQSVSVDRDSADVARASERLSQQIAGLDTSRVSSAEQARDRLGQLQLDIAHNPGNVVGAFKMNQDSFLAAVAEPSD